MEACSTGQVDVRNASANTPQVSLLNAPESNNHVGFKDKKVFSDMIEACLATFKCMFRTIVEKLHYNYSREKKE